MLPSLGNFEAEDSEAKQKYDAQVQINLQLQEQKKWLEHELEEVGKCRRYIRAISWIK
jgi:hypothetical protein